MEKWIDVQMLIWLFPILFIFHDFEEIIIIEKWMNKNTNVIYRKLPEKMANRVIKQFTMSTAQFAFAVLVIFFFVSVSAILASQYFKQGLFGSIYLFLICTLVFFLHAFTHIGQSILLHSITPGVVTSTIIIIPYSIVLYKSLLENGFITWGNIFISLPFVVLLIPVALFAHWLGKKVI